MAIQEEAARFFVSLLAGTWAPRYLAGRRVRTGDLRSWGIGYAPAGWTTLVEHLRGLGYADDEIETSGLAKRSSRGTLIDVFRDRIVFPVRSADGAVLGFIGRARRGEPVYLNCTTTDRYRKGEVLLGLYEGRDAFAAGARPVVVEGPFDAIAVTAAGNGFYAGVAPCGTALTRAQVAALARVTADRDHAVVMFDADEAGRRAAVHAYDVLRDHFERPMVVELPAGYDPSSFSCLYGGGALTRQLDMAAMPLADLVTDAVLARFERWLEFTDGTFNALGAVAPVIARLASCDVARQVARTAERLGLSHEEVTRAVTDAWLS
jgi:DNA primase catalytic core